MTFNELMQAAASAYLTGRAQEAENLSRQLVAQCRGEADALHVMGVLAGLTKRYDVAADLIRRSLAMHSENAEAHSHLADILAAQGKIDEAIAEYRIAIASDKNLFHAPNNLGNLFLDRGQFDDAIAAFQHAIQIKPDYVDACSNLGNALAKSGKFDEALAAFERAIAIQPDHAGAHWNTALVLLRLGNFDRGWAEYEWGFRAGLRPNRNFPQPQWNGQPLDGKTILLHAEQGFGDCIQFVRYAPLVAQRGGKIILECHSELGSLLRDIPAIQQIIHAGKPLPAFDFHSSLLSLPRVFQTISANIPYLQPRRAIVEKWRNKLGPKNQLRVGIAWAGSPTHRDDIDRSIPASLFASLTAIPEVQFFSLQKGPKDKDAVELKLIDHTQELTDFQNTAALIACLDLVISVDTAVAHLAGAMGKPFYVLLPWLADWRWLLDRSDSPWYPTAELFRQPTRGDWAQPLAEITAKVATLARK